MMLAESSVSWDNGKKIRGLTAQNPLPNGSYAVVKEPSSTLLVSAHLEASHPEVGRGPQREWASLGFGKL